LLIDLTNSQDEKAEKRKPEKSRFICTHVHKASAFTQANKKECGNYNSHSIRPFCSPSPSRQRRPTPGQSGRPPAPRAASAAPAPAS